MTAPSHPLGPDPFAVLHEAHDTVRRGYEGQNAIELVNMLDHLPHAVDSFGGTIGAMAELAQSNVHLDPRVAPLLSQLGELIKRTTSPVEDVAGSVRRAHDVGLNNIIEGQGNARRQAWDISKNPL